MRAVIQRVSRAEVRVAGEPVGRIGPGLCVLLGIAKDDGQSNADRLAEKLKNLRIFEDENGKMNRSVEEVRQEVLVVSQFTLYGDCTKGNRPSFSDAAAPDDAEQLYKYFVLRLRSAGLTVATGKFKARMEVALTNDGPVTFIVQT
ncbi:MAG TPA: D-aminoacyl-tRNA deacylase [Candidatus Binatia bacterium]|nr:D-aminoacyl-tRNA deacylase [Candidatus Binatia bacterium]